VELVRISVFEQNADLYWTRSISLFDPAQAWNYAQPIFIRASLA
jgi:hypothetical protein